MRTWQFNLEIKEGNDEYWEGLKDDEITKLLDDIQSALEDYGFFNTHISPIKFTKDF